ncbi:MAG: M28 family peptidase [Candidatus Hydrogenedens sp.]|nr:M28 family peptidase [Candidatus Hydrogenedens sp.]
MSEALPDNTEPIGPHLDRKRTAKQVHEDLMYLAARLLHRGAQTQDEAAAADYLFKRFRERTPDVHKDTFTAIESVPYLFGSHFAEFLFVAVIAFWVPAMAAIYGAAVFVLYLSEFLGFPLLSRLMPQFESQNVVARFLAPRPENLIIVTAHYDSGCATPITRPGYTRWWRLAHFVLVSCMVVIIATCAAGAYAQAIDAAMPILGVVRIAATAILLCGALLLYYASSESEEIRGANNNASGVSVLLALADRIARHPIENADVWLVGTGSHEAWMAGMRHLLAGASFDKPHTYVFNIEGVGAGDLSFTTSEGMLLELPCDKTMKAVAEETAKQGPAVCATRMRAVPTAAHIALNRGYKSLSLLGLGADGVPPRWNAIDDLITGVDEDQIVRAIDWSEQFVRNLADSAPPARR